ncbi:DUF1145 family protein [Acerihabitans sp. TG2]|uniref:DUF1145 family protein n=1 Tax=Acerihabitans sp. TG2 TaxID=3096008 RepID=UPI002B22E19A|nr:DUF1145 family protein [Acerihabitans sp. TG2]MEA9389863.1 DUF1145 family protein [Acerihabitans sp. TG2]
MGINFGRFLMLLIWVFLLFNLIHPFQRPLNFFFDFALFFMVAMHGLQLILLKATLTRDEPKLSRVFQAKMFLFGVFEMLAWQKKQRSQNRVG